MRRLSTVCAALDPGLPEQALLTGLLTEAGNLISFPA